MKFWKRKKTETAPSTQTSGLFYQNQSSKGKRNILMIFIGTTLLLGGFIVYTYVFKSQDDHKNQSAETMTDEERLESHVKESTVRYQEFRTLSDDELKQKTQEYNQ